LDLETYLSYLKDVETSQRGFMLTGDPIFLEPYEKIFSEFDRLELNLREKTEPQFLERLNTIFLLSKQKRNFVENVILSTKQRKNKSVTSIKLNSQGKKNMDEIRIHVKQLLDKK
jgi:CHASE3 domain sensor protein